ncbi:hypothetical protein DAEQUDRAFT_235669 [Daedalea quercina L-15889]|uniref:Uncharacterized protein n=1 Tax=Daedalea quercina L-15889 TaxID=1314783 RepID=A0A165QW23_9APHY|nr:hypothetical protein DAEQUDRAFT_235669 [Daedalea quercina L-15889]
MTKLHTSWLHSTTHTLRPLRRDSPQPSNNRATTGAAIQAGYHDGTAVVLIPPAACPMTDLANAREDAVCTGVCRSLGQEINTSSPESRSLRFAGLLIVCT